MEPQKSSLSQVDRLSALHAADLLHYYNFDLQGFSVEQLLARWLGSCSADWVRLAVIEALYQGRYKAISVEQILVLWYRREQVICHFNGEFERLVTNRVPHRTELEAELSPLLPPASPPSGSPSPVNSLVSPQPSSPGAAKTTDLPGTKPKPLRTPRPTPRDWLLRLAQLKPSTSSPQIPPLKPEPSSPDRLFALTPPLPTSPIQPFSTEAAEHPEPCEHRVPLPPFPTSELRSLQQPIAPPEPADQPLPTLPVAAAIVPLCADALPPTSNGKGYVTQQPTNGTPPTTPASATPPEAIVRNGATCQAAPEAAIEPIPDPWLDDQGEAGPGEIGGMD